MFLSDVCVFMKIIIVITMADLLSCLFLINLYFCCFSLILFFHCLIQKYLTYVLDIKYMNAADVTLHIYDVKKSFPHFSIHLSLPHLLFAKVCL